MYEARKEVGGRVLSNPTFSEGRITEEGAELIGSFHTKWLELAREYGLAMISRMEPELYEREGLDVQTHAGQAAVHGRVQETHEEMDEEVLMPLADCARSIRIRPALAAE